MKKLLFSFEGRINRQPYWLFNVALIVVLGVTAAIDMSIGDPEPGFLSVGLMLFSWWPSLAIQVKRWHDRDKSGWWVLISLIPVIGAIWALVENGFLTGTEGNNRFGSNPLE
jgi:uncharacterized membrane protein YhaH (DUF805 family)